MGKRSDFKRVARDAYDTPPEAVLPLLSHLPRKTRYIEPCAGRGKLIEALTTAGHECIYAYDAEPPLRYVTDSQRVWAHDALHHRPARETLGEADCFITNPPWDRAILHPLILHLISMRPAWLLFDADWVHTRQAEPYMPHLRKIVSVGRVKWIPGTKMTGKDNCAWHLFEQDPRGITQFFGRVSG